MSDTPPEEILSRIQKLLRLAHGQGATEGEAANALAKANELLLRYNLSADFVAAARGDDRPARMDEARIKLGRRENWQHRLLIVLARHNFCDAFFSADWIVFVGRVTNVAATREMFNWIAPQVERMAEHEWREFSKELANVLLTEDNSWCPECEEGNWREPGRKCRDCGATLISPKIHGKTWKTNYYRGLTWRLSQRLYDERKAVEQGESSLPTQPEVPAQTMALAIRNLQLATRQENDTYIKQHHGALTTKRAHSSRYDRTAYRRGAAAGDRVSLRGNRLGGANDRALPGA